MAEQVLKMRIQLRRATTAEWEANKSVVPAAGEPCFDLELNTLKIGDGVKTYEQLDAIGGSGSITVSADGTSIVMPDGVFKLAGFDAADVGAQPRKGEDGTLEWIVPSGETLEGLQTIVAGLQTDVEDLQTDVSAIQEILTPPGEDEEPLLTRVESLETKMDGTGEGSVDAKITAKINEFATRITDDEVVNSYQELITWVANHGGEAATMAADIASLQALVGDDPVSSQIATAVAGIDTGDPNVIESISMGGTLLEIAEKSVNIPVATADALGVVKGSDEITVAADGSLGIGAVSVSKLVQEDGIELVLDGGAAG